MWDTKRHIDKEMMTHTQRQREYEEKKIDRHKIELFFNPRFQFGHVDVIQS
jgi:hypothetical protein